ncbi:hypothetical protein D3C72_1246570 [compost metagenome]
MDLSKALESSDLEQKIRRQKKTITDLEKEHTNLTAIISEASAEKEGTLANTLLVNIQKQIDELTFRRDGLIDEIGTKEDQFNTIISAQKEKYDSQESKFTERNSKLEAEYKEKEEALSADFKIKSKELDQKIRVADADIVIKIATAERKANTKVKLINQFSDFLEETNKNMSLYSWVIIGLLAAAIIAISFSVPALLNVLDVYNAFITKQGIFISTWHIINFSLGLLIVKLPWALCLSAVLTGIYRLLKGLLVTYEKINQDKRNMSAIYAISGNVAQSLNEYGMAVAEEEVEDEETEAKFTSIRVEKKGLEQKRENLRWNQIMNYFERMQQNKEEIALADDDPSKLKLVTDLLNKVIEKSPKQ